LIDPQRRLVVLRIRHDHDGGEFPGLILKQAWVLFPSPPLDELKLGGRTTIAPQQPALGFHAVHLNPHGRVQQWRQLAA